MAANIKEYLEAIKKAIYGEEVRSAIHDAIEAINNDSTFSSEELPLGANLDDYKQNGLYKIPSDGTAATISNLPRPDKKHSGTLLVLRAGTSADRVTQVFFTASNETDLNLIYYRTLGEYTGWQKWQGLEGPTAENFEGVLPVKKGGTGNETGYLPIIQLGTNIPEIEKTNPKTGIYNVEGRPLPNTLTEFYYRVIVLGDHQQTPAGYSTEIIVPYDGGNTRHIIVRTSDSKQWNSPRTLAYMDDLPTTIFDLCPNGIMHRNLFRGKNLGDRVTDEQLAAIKDGSFKDLFIGDYWAINDVNWLIADMDYFYQAGNKAFTKHHLVIIPQGCLYTAQMNSTNTTKGGYVGSEMYTKNLERAKETIKAAFPNMVLSHRDVLISATHEGYPSGYIWTDSEVELMTEVMVYGTYHYAVMNPGSYLTVKYTTARQQFAIFALNPYYALIGRNWYWLRDVVSATYFANCNPTGGASSNDASESHGVCPYFCIGSNGPNADMPVEGPEIVDEYTQNEMEK